MTEKKKIFRQQVMQLIAATKVDNEMAEPLLDSFIGQLFKTTAEQPHQEIVYSQMEIQTDTFRANDEFLMDVKEQISELKAQMDELKEVVDNLELQIQVQYQDQVQGLKVESQVLSTFLANTEAFVSQF